MKRTAFQDLKRLTLLLTYGMEDSPWRASTGFIPPTPDPPDVSRLTVRTPSPGEVVDADAVVIGSGAGGSVAAAVLAAAGRRVVVLERAAMVTEEHFGGPELEGLAGLFLDRGLTATSDRWIAIRAGSAVGGGTVVNWSTSLRAPAAVRDEWRAAGIDDDLDEHYAAVETDLDVTTAESAPNGPNGRLEAGLAELGLSMTVVPRNVRDCGDCGPCAVGCRRGAKRSALRTYLADGVPRRRHDPRPDGGAPRPRGWRTRDRRRRHVCPAARSPCGRRSSPWPAGASSRRSCSCARGSPTTPRGGTCASIPSRRSPASTRERSIPGRACPRG